MALPRRSWCAVSAAFASAAVLAALSLAGAFNPLSEIGAADHPNTPNDMLSPAVQAQLRADSPPSGGVDQIGSRLTDSARLVGTLPSGRKVSVVASTKGRLCVVVALPAESCSDPLSPAQPSPSHSRRPGNGRARLRTPMVLPATAFDRSRSVTAAIT